MILSVLIPSLATRAKELNELVSQLRKQAAGHPVQILTLVDNKETPTGTKRNTLLEEADGEYIAFFDDDDRPSDDYITSILTALESSPDCVGFKGYFYTRRSRQEWIISNALPYVDAQINRQTVYLRHTNHIAPVRREIALQAKFPDIYREEDYQYALRLRESGLLKTEVFINKHLYHYIK